MEFVLLLCEWFRLGSALIALLFNQMLLSADTQQAYESLEPKYGNACWCSAVRISWWWWCFWLILDIRNSYWIRQKPRLATCQSKDDPVWRIILKIWSLSEFAAASWIKPSTWSGHNVCQSCRRTESWSLAPREWPCHRSSGSAWPKPCQSCPRQ